MQFVSAQEKVALEKKREELYKAQIDVQDRIRKAASLGDLSENAEYHFAKEENRNIQRQLAELEAKLKNVSVISNEAVPDNVVFIGHTVKLMDMDDESEMLVRIVGEAQPATGGRYHQRQRQQPHGRSPHQGPRRRYGQSEGPTRNHAIQNPRNRRLKSPRSRCRSRLSTPP